MSRPNSLNHPLVLLRQQLGLGRQQFSLRLGVSQVTVEKWERGERTFSAVQRQKVFRETGVCPGWLADPQGPIHTADGYPYTAKQYEHWQAVKGPVQSNGRRLGQHYCRNCCPGVMELLAHGPAAPEADARRIQRLSRAGLLERLRQQLVDLARGVAASARRVEDEDRLLAALAALRRIFPGVQPRPDPDEQAAAERLHAEMSAAVRPVLRKKVRGSDHG